MADSNQLNAVRQATPINEVTLPALQMFMSPTELIQQLNSLEKTLMSGAEISICGKVRDKIKLQHGMDARARFICRQLQQELLPVY